MTFFILTVTLLSQISFPAMSDPSGGYRATLVFEDPYLLAEDDGYFVMFNGTGLRVAEGEPLRPVLTLFVPVPPDAEPEVRFHALDYRRTGIDSGQARTPVITGTGLDTRELPAEPVPAIDSHAVLEGVYPVAGTQIAVIRIYPITGEDPGAFASRIGLEVTWEPRSGGISVERNHLLRLIAPPGSLYWPDEHRSRADDIFWGRPWARVAIASTGGYRLTGSDLLNSECEAVGAPCASLALYTGPGVMFGQEPEDEHYLSEVAFTVNDYDGDGLFDTDDTIEFFGRGLSRWDVSDGDVIRLQHRYATHNIYWLTWGGEDGERISQVSGTPDSSPQWGDTIISDIWLREEHIWKPQFETSTGWIWESVSEGGSVTVGFQAGSYSGSGSIRISLVMDSSQYHEVDVYLSGSQIFTDSWFGSGEHILQIDNVELSGAEEVEIRFIEDGSGGNMGLASIHVENPWFLGNVTGAALFPFRERIGRYNFNIEGVSQSCSVFDISIFDSPEVLSGTGYEDGNLFFSMDIDSFGSFMIMDQGDWMQPDSLRSASPGRLVGTVDGGDRLLIVHPSLLSGVWGIEALSMETGYLPVVATTTEIYDEFGQGVADPGAIRSSVRWAMDYWSPGLEGVILVGDGHYDFLSFTTTQPVMIPPWIVIGTSRTDCQDDKYVMVHENAVLPEVPIARMPVDNLAELGTCTAKLLGYGTGQSGGTWNNRALLVADDEWGQGGNWNDTGHTNDCERIAEEVLPRSLDREKFYSIEYPWPPGTSDPYGPHPEKPLAREDLIESISRGCAFLLYIGHGAANQISHEKILLSEDIGLLSNGARLPVSFWSTCDVGHFDNPGSDAIGETMVLAPAGGSISSVAATRGTYGSANYQYFRSIVDSLCTHTSLNVGDAVWQSKLALSDSYYSNNKYYVMFGYPDLPLPLPPADGAVDVESDTLRSGEFNSVTGTGFQDEGLAFIRILESSLLTTYTCLGGSLIVYLKYGGTAYNGTQIVDGGGFQIDIFVPLQSVTGDLARASAITISGDAEVAGARDPTVLASGNPSGGDLEGPDVTMWLRGYEGVDHPEVTGDITLEAEISDSSGICLLGGFGRELSLFVDGTGTDVSSWFSYHQGSSTSGRLTYDIEALAPGEHTLILWSVDGLGNTSRDTLDLGILENQDLSITEAFVYPNPGCGSRVFSFRISEDTRIIISIFTIAGRKIDEVSGMCGQGYNQIMWNGLDHDGDWIASGSYIYRIEANALGSSVFSRTTSYTGILAVTREGEF